MIPEELKTYKQWVVATSSPFKQNDKIPLDPKTLRAASPTDPSTWATYDEAVKATNSAHPHIGFVLTKNDPYCFVDLDDPNDPKAQRSKEQIKTIEARHQLISSYFKTYQEVSQSGKGIHIICRATLPGQGKRKDCVELYDKERFMIMTGQVYIQEQIQDCQDLVSTMYYEMCQDGGDPSKIQLVEKQERLSDQEIVEIAMNAANADKFNKLCAGDWQQDYSSQSEADLALMTILAYYTKSNEQVRRIFRMSALGKRDKAVRNDKYLDYNLRRIRSNQVSDDDLERGKQLAERLIQNASVGNGDSNIEHSDDSNNRLVESTGLEGESSLRTDPSFGTSSMANFHSGVSPSDSFWPPGLVGQIGQYIEASSNRPVKEIALGAAIGLMAGIAGRVFNISQTGLNQYLVVVAGTGMGKEEGPKGIERLLMAIRNAGFVNATDVLGPAMFASGQAMIKTLDTNPCFLSVLGEIGLWFQNISNPKANTATLMIRRMLLDLYSKSGHYGVLRGSVYADSDKNTKDIYSPALSILGDSTPSTLYSGLTSDHIAEGLLSRFTILEYHGKRPKKNPNAGFSPDDILVTNLMGLMEQAYNMGLNQSVHNIYIDVDGLAVLDQFDEECDYRINNSNNDVQAQLWNRGHLKALKMSGLIAVGVNWFQPVVTREIAQWAVKFITSEIQSVLKRYEDGDIDSVSSIKRDNDLERIIREYYKMDVDGLKGYNVPKLYHGDGIISYDYLRRKTRTLASFRNDARGPSRALQDQLNDMVKAGILIEIDKSTAREKYQTRSSLYILQKEI